MPSKFADFIKAQKIDPRRIAASSRLVERLRPEDRAIRLKKRLARAGDAKPAAGEAGPKPRTGRPVTAQILSRALEGKSVAGPAKTRLLRAVNRILEQKKFLKTRKEGRGHLYIPLISKADYEAASLTDMVERVFEGTPASLVRRLLDATDLKASDLEEIRQLLEAKTSVKKGGRS